MIINLEQNVLQKDIEISITYPVKNKIVERIVSLIKSVDMQIECYSDDIVKLVNVFDIYYIESVDGKTIFCCEKENTLLKAACIRYMKNYGTTILYKLVNIAF